MKNKPRETWIGLATALGYSSQAFKTWRTFPGAPQTPSPEPWRKFIAKHGLGVSGNHPDAKRESLLSQLNERKLRLADLEIARKESRLVLRTDMDALHHAIFTRQKAVLSAALESEYPGKVVGRTAAEIRVAGAKLRDRLCDIFEQDVANWQWTPDDAKL